MTNSNEQTIIKPIPTGYHTITPYLTVEGGGKLIEFLMQAFDAVEMSRSTRPDGGIGNAELKIGDSMLMIADSRAEWKPMPSTIYLYVNDTDAVYQKAIEAGAESLMQPADMLYGDRNAGVKDMCGNYWWIATHFEDVSPEELNRRHQERNDG